MPFSTARKAVISYHSLQLWDAALIWLSFWIALWLRAPLRDALGLGPLDAPLLSGMSWVLYIAVPFPPLLLEYFGFHEGVQGKSRGTAFKRLAKALAVMAVVLGLLSLVARLPEVSRPVL